MEIAQPNVPPVAGTKVKQEENHFSLEVTATVRMSIIADDEAQAREILRALLGNGDWCQIQRAGHPVHAALRLT